LKWESSFSSVTGKLSSTDYLPYIPADKWVNELKLKWKEGKKVKGLSTFVQAEAHFSQTHPALFETPTNSYWLLNAGISGSISTKKTPIILSLTANNLLNETYYDHLSRFKDYGIYNIGRNIVLHMNIPLLIHQKK
jgi:iron complex outermembrane recepter protein